jgi:hypothetical protein
LKIFGIKGGIMGQRLNIEIHNNGKLLANAYYHWSGYTSSALYLTKIVMDNIKICKHRSKIMTAIRLLEATGAKLTETEFKATRRQSQTFRKITSGLEYKDEVDRNDGLIAVSTKGMEETRLWEEARVEIDLKSQTIFFDAVYEVDEEELISYGTEIGSIPSINDEIDLSQIRFTDFEYIFNTLLEIYNNQCYYFKIRNHIIAFIA